MNISNKLHKQIKTIIMTTGEYPEEIEISKKDFEELRQEVCKVCTSNPPPNQDYKNAKFEGVKLKVID